MIIIIDITTLNLIDMYYAGMIKKDGDYVATFKTNEYNIDIERREAIKYQWMTESSYRYLCTLRFKDLMNRVILELTFTEVDALVMIDNIAEFLSCGQIMDELLISHIKSKNPYEYYEMGVRTVYDNEYLSNPKILLQVN